MDGDLHRLQKEARAFGIRLDKDHLDRFRQYERELRLWNAKTNLISESTQDEILSRHFLDSLTAMPFIQPYNARVIDIGCGAGFPGIPLAIASPSLQLTLLEASRKKVSFLKHILRLLDRTDITVLHDRVEAIINHPNLRAQFDVVISRAAFKLPDLMAMSTYFLAPGGLLIAMKGANVAEELKLAEKQKTEFKINEINQHDINNLFLGAPRKIILGRRA